MRAKMESDEVLTWDDRCIYIYQARDGRSMQIAPFRRGRHASRSSDRALFEPENAGELAQALEEAEASMTGTRRRAGGQMRPTGPTWALKVGAMTATRRLASGQMLGNREIAQ